MHPFPLLHLPLVAKENVLSMMISNELIELSLTSKRVRKTVTNFSKIIPKFRVTLGVTSILYISIVLKGKNYAYTWETDGSDQKRKTENPIELWMFAYNYIKGVLRCQLDKIHINLSSCPRDNKSITDWLLSQQETVAKAEISNSGVETDDDLKYIMSNITVTDKLMLSSSEYKENFQMEIPSISTDLFIANSRFVDFEQLLRLKNLHITLYESRLTNQELNKFLKSWMAFESHLMLETFEINVSGPEAMEVIMDLPHEETADQNVTESFREKFPHHIDETVEIGFDIKRKDGKVATVCYGNTDDGHLFFMFTR
uniref:FBA_2 domain-containing protein n=2 Tax=Caenorhabditis tropicalis TaxID=1561998 RepID=A0A1I7TUN4_9PELO